jgi:hypothetical protein
MKKIKEPDKFVTYNSFQEMKDIFEERERNRQTYVSESVG